MSRWTPLPAAFYGRPADQVARDLLGRFLVRKAGGHRLVLRLVETEAYLGAPDRASHAWNGRRTERVKSLYLPGGHAYVYFIYGMHYCLNAVTGEPDVGSAVLLRAGEPVEGAKEMTRRRALKRPPRPGDLAGGPAKLCKALGIDRAQDGLSLLDGDLTITHGNPADPKKIATGPRVGIDYAEEAKDWPLRFAIANHPEMSQPKLK